MTPPPPEVAERIRHKKAQYTRFADSKQWERFDSIFVEDATYEFVDAGGELIRTPDGAVAYQWRSRESWVAFFRAAFADLQVIHLVGAGELEQGATEDEVRAVFSVLYHAGPKAKGGDAADRGPGPHETGGGHYYETWVRRDGDWFCKELRMQRLYHRAT